MTFITLYVTPRGQIIGYSAIGHTNYSDAGSDIVCAGVSTITQCTADALTGVARVPTKVTQRGGLLYVRVSKVKGLRWHDAQVILRTCARSLSQLSSQYPDFISVKWKRQVPNIAG